MPARPRLLLDVRPLRASPPFRRLWAGTVLSALGGTMTTFAVILQVYQLTGSVFATGALGLVRLVPVLTVAMLGGAWADRVDRRKLVFAGTLAATALSAGLLAQAAAGLRQVWLLYALVAGQAAASSVITPARRTFVPRLLPAGLLPAGLALSQATMPVTLIAGPALGGVLTSAGGVRLCYLADVLSFAASLYSVARLPAMPPTAALADRSLRAVAEGVRFIARSQPLAGAFLADLNATVLALPVALFPAINAERFGGSPQSLGLLTSAIGAGGLLGLVFSGPVGHVTRPGRGMTVTVSAWGAALAGFGAAGSLPLALACLALAGAADTITVVFRGMIVQTVIPEGMRGRITAADFVVGYGGGQLGSLESGAVGALFTPAVSAVSGGLATVAVAVALVAALPGFTRYRLPLPAPGEPGGARDPGPPSGAAQEPGSAATPA